MADVPTEKCLDDFFAKRDKKKKKEKGKGKEPATGPTVLVKKNKKEKEKNTKSENQDAQLEKVMYRRSVTFSRQFCWPVAVVSNWAFITTTFLLKSLLCDYTN